MSLPVVYRRAARAEFDDDASWYERKRAGLGTRFVRAVEKVLDQASTEPGYFPEVHQGVREALVPNFPYCVYYVVEPGRVVVLSVFHSSRDPAVWQGRA